MTTTARSVYLVGSASGIAAQNAGCEQGPQVLKDSTHLQGAFTTAALNPIWEAILTPNAHASSTLAKVSEHCRNLASEVAKLAHQQKFFMVFGGDHSSAIGTWSGAASEIKGDMGLVWVDAHMDSHTPETSLSGNIHGMPVATLLGYGYPELTQILTATPKIKPENLCLIGIRSFEAGEADLLKRLNVRVYYMAEVKERGLDIIFKEAIAHVTKNTVQYGLTIDIDSIDPLDAPATGVSEPDGLSATELCTALTNFAHDKRLIGIEIVEFDPHLDKNQMTEKLIAKLALSLLV
jgi:arginase